MWLIAFFQNRVKSLTPAPGDAAGFLLVEHEEYALNH